MASVSIRSLYHYFPNKEAAGGPVIDRHNNETMQLYGNRWLGWRCSQSRRYANSSSSDRRPSRQSEGTPRAGGSRWPSARLVPVRHATTARLAGNDRLATTDAEHGRSIDWSVPELHIFRSGTGCTDLGSSNATTVRHRFRRYRTTSPVTSSTNRPAFSPARMSGRCKTAACVSASSAVTQMKAAISVSATSTSSRCASR